jgi:hypothetical protein
MEEIKDDNRREIKRKIISLQTMLRVNDMTADNKRLLEKNIIELRKSLLTLNTKPNLNYKDQIIQRRKFIETNPGLRDIFQALWLVFGKYTNDGFLSKEGYSKFNHAIQMAVVGARSFDDINQIIESDWVYDKAVFGPFNQQGFFDLVFETIGKAALVEDVVMILTVSSVISCRNLD